MLRWCRCCVTKSTYAASYVDAITNPIPERAGEGGWLSSKLTPELAVQLRRHVVKMVKEGKFTTPPSIVSALQSE